MTGSQPAKQNPILKYLVAMTGLGFVDTGAGTLEAAL